MKTFTKFLTMYAFLCYYANFPDLNSNQSLKKEELKKQ